MACQRRRCAEEGMHFVVEGPTCISGMSVLWSCTTSSSDCAAGKHRPARPRWPFAAPAWSWQATWMTSLTPQPNACAAQARIQYMWVAVITRIMRFAAGRYGQDQAAKARERGLEMRGTLMPQEQGKVAGE